MKVYEGGKQIRETHIRRENYIPMYTERYKNRKTNNVKIGKTLVKAIHGQTN